MHYYNILYIIIHSIYFHPAQPGHHTIEINYLRNMKDLLTTTFSFVQVILLLLVLAVAGETIEQHVDFRSVVHSHHVYKEIWMPEIDEELVIRVEDGNGHNSYSVVVVKTGIIVGHMPKEHSQVVWCFITRGGRISSCH